MNLSPLPIQKFFDNNGRPLVGGLLFTYVAGTTTKVATYTDRSGGTPNTNPIELDFRGECRIWLDPMLAYKFTLSPRDDSDPPTAPIWTVDDITVAPMPFDNYADDTGSVNNVSVDIPWLSSISAGTRIVFRAAATNTGPMTLTVNGGSANPITWQSRVELSPTAVVALGLYQVIFDGGNWQLQGPTLTRGDVRLFGAVGDGVTDDTAAIQAAHDAAALAGGARPYLPAGEYLISTAINPCLLGMYGDGPAKSNLICSNCNTFTVPSNAGIDRPQQIFEKFQVNSDNGTSCDDNWVFYYGGVASGAAVVHNSGVIIRDMAVGRFGRMGGFIYVKDVFSMNVENISLTDVSRGVQVVGSVVQSTWQNISAFSDNAGVALLSRGFTTESALYSSGTATPEHITQKDCSWIVFNVGIEHTAGLNVIFENVDTQTRQIGMDLNAPVNAKTGVHVPHSSNVAAWIGVNFGVSPGTKDARYVHNQQISMGNMPGSPALSYGFNLGDGASPVRGVTLKECSVTGLANSLQNLVRGRINDDLTMMNCNFDAAVALSTEMVFTSMKRLAAIFNQCAGGILSVGDGGDAAANGMIVGNQVSTLTLSPLTSPQNWTIGMNDGLTPVRFGWEQGTTTLTLTGCTTAPTVDAAWIKTGMHVDLFIPPISGTSNAVTCSLTGMAATIRPPAVRELISRATDNGVNGICGYRVQTTGTIDMFFGAALAGWTAAGSKGLSNVQLGWQL